MPFVVGLRRLSGLVIDTIKDWGGYRITNLGAPTSATDALRKGTRLTMGEMPDGPSGEVVTGQGVGVSPAYGAVAGVKITTGSYTGNVTQNRAIAHGLGTTPRMVFIGCVANADSSGTIYGTEGRLWNETSLTPRTVTAPDATNFYVGDAVDYILSLNHSIRTYFWMAIA